MIGNKLSSLGFKPEEENTPVLSINPRLRGYRYRWTVGVQKDQGGYPSTPEGAFIAGGWDRRFPSSESTLYAYSNELPTEEVEDLRCAKHIKSDRGYWYYVYSPFQ